MSRDGGGGGGRRRGPGSCQAGTAASEEPAGGAADSRRPRLSARGGAGKQDGGVGPVRLHQVHAALPLRGALAGPTALQGRWAPGVHRTAPRQGPGIMWVRPVSTLSRLLAGWGWLGRAWLSRVGLSRAATSPPCRRDPVQTLSPQLWLGLPSPSTGRQGRCLHFLARNPEPEAAELMASCFPVPESEATGLGTECSDLELLPFHKSRDAVCEQLYKITSSFACKPPLGVSPESFLSFYQFHIPLLPPCIR